MLLSLSLVSLLFLVSERVRVTSHRVARVDSVESWCGCTQRRRRRRRR